MRIFQTDISATIYLVVERNIIGGRIRQARKAAKPPVTQADLVARLQILAISIDQSALSKIETGQRPISDIEVLAFAKALKLSVSWLFAESDVDLTAH